MATQQMFLGMGAGGFEASGGTETTYSSGGTNYKAVSYTHLTLPTKRIV